MGKFARFHVVASSIVTGSLALAAPKPSISKAIANPTAEILLIYGQNFDEEPEVWLDGIPLHVMSSTDTLIEAELPPLDPGTYLLVVSREGSRFPGIARAAMDVTLGAVGPEGPAGPPGTQGPQGDPGQPGTPGQDGSRWFTGDGPPPPDLGNPGDLYLDQISGDVYRNDGAWTRVSSIAGPPGLPGMTSDPRDELAALLGIEISEVSVPLEAVSKAQCGAGAVLALSTSAGSPGTVVGLVGEESISAPFRFRVAVRSAGGSDPSNFVGAEATITMGNVSTSSLRGIVSGADFGGTKDGEAIYVLTIEPLVVRARAFSGFNTFENQTAGEIVGSVLNGFAVPVSLSGGGSRLDYEAQWNESSLDFVRRLMEREGMHFHFADDGTMMVGESNGVFGAGPALPYLGHFADPGDAETVSSFRVGSSPSPGSATVRGWDYVEKDDIVGTAASPGTGAIVTFLTDATSVAVANERAQTLLARERSSALLRTGTSNSPAIRAGRTIAITGSGGAFDGSYVVTKVTHTAFEEDGCFGYGNRFSALPADVPFQPEARTPVPKIKGTVSALVTRVSDPDGLFRVKVRFPWLPSSESNWARIAVASVGGAPFVLPEVGDEVLVAFDGGDVRFPVVLGGLWNGEDKPPTTP